MSEGQTSEAAPAIQRPLEERKATLDRALQRLGAEGWHIETRSELQATIAKGKQINHTLHLILSIVTAGLWAIVWIVMAVRGGVKRRMVTIDEYGNILDRKI